MLASRFDDGREERPKPNREGVVGRGYRHRRRDAEGFRSTIATEDW